MNNSGNYDGHLVLNCRDLNKKERPLNLVYYELPLKEVLSALKLVPNNIFNDWVLFNFHPD